LTPEALGEARYSDVNGVHMYYETSGAGEPLLLLHGGFGGVHVFGGQVPAFAQRYRVLVPEQRGRGHTPDAEGPISYQLLADDIIAFLEAEVGEPVLLVGVSDGGIVGLLVATQRPELLAKLVTVGANFHGDGLLSSALWTDASPDDEAWTAPRQRYAAVSPDGLAHFPVVFAKLQHMWRDGQPTLSTGDLARIPVPVLVLVGDDDIIDHAHTVTMYEAILGGQLAVIPGASHAVFMEKPELLNRIVLDFLAEQGSPETLLPVRRAARRRLAPEQSRR
jgi:pimeloyl-ACP methyl ester carboxylesterase